MPISAPRQPSALPAAALEANRSGIALREQGRFAEAAQRFRQAADAAPETPEFRINLAVALADAGAHAEAEAAYRDALRLDPQSAAAASGFGALLVRLGRFDEARPVYERLLQSDPRNVQANLAMYELEQIAGNPAKALEHQLRVLRRQTLFSEPAPREQRRVLVLLAPGDWQANVPVDFLVDRTTTTLHKLYVVDEAQIESVRLPDADVVFVAIAESDENEPRLELARGIVDRTGLPVINRPERIALTNRVKAAALLDGIEAAIVPRTQRISRPDASNAQGLPPFPIVIRPVGSQAGKDLERIADASALQTYLARVQAEAFFVMPFIDFSKEDGFFRKYRIIIVDGEPIAYHLAISPNWMIHYYNAPMREHQWMRDEERRFLEHFEDVFPQPLREALREIARRLELEYVGVDCSIDRSGRLVLFEADPAMIVHAGDDPALFSYKFPAAHRVFAAFERLVQRVGSR